MSIRAVLFVCLKFVYFHYFTSLTMSYLFKHSDKHNTKVIGHMLDILTPLIVEADSVSQDILDVVLSSILEPYKVFLCANDLQIVFPSIVGIVAEDVRLTRSVRRCNTSHLYGGY
jgi:hypothetical protein